MKRTSTWLLEHKQDVYSQMGEDGIIEKILEELPERDSWCVEFGAWDGLHLTNTRHLIESKNYSAVLIEADKKRFRDLQGNYSNNSKVCPINTFVGFKEDDNLDQILSNTPIPNDFDLLSIDIDGNDYHVWNAISKYKPKVVVIEFNPTVPTHIEFTQPADASVNQGSSLLSLVQLGRKKGYELVSVLPWNAFFVRKEYYPAFQIECNEPEVLRTNLDYITYLFSGFDGKIFLRGRCRLDWHAIEMKESKLQYLPKILRKFPGNFNAIELVAFGLYILVTNPTRLFAHIRDRIRPSRESG